MFVLAWELGYNPVGKYVEVGVMIYTIYRPFAVVLANGMGYNVVGDEFWSWDLIHREVR